MLQVTIEKAHIAGSVNTPADFFSTLELKVTEKIRLKIKKDIQRTPIESTTFSSDVADEDQFIFTEADTQNKS